DCTEYIWLDELCLPGEASQRSEELGRIPDIFRYAAKTVVFCDEEGCDHTGPSCIWGQRLFTIAEILHAQKVLTLTPWRNGDVLEAKLQPWEGCEFREAMQSKAARENKWHLYAIFQHAANAGTVPWQMTIHALVVEAIRRDEAGDYHEHKFLGKALNGLLPRRARLKDLGINGWADLALLLELNQGFYNAASLAAVCGVADPNSAPKTHSASKTRSTTKTHSVSWLGKPLDPGPGNERLHPIVTAFPVFDSKAASDPALVIVEGETLDIRRKLPKRDARGLYNNQDMVALRAL
ncbi:hypothetical protein GGX14DRAFT_322186, partial [Mycena pura]